jgi:hypothetical protein
MPFYLVESYMSKNPNAEAQGGHVICGERRLIKQLYRQCMKKGYKPHQFSEWLHRKYGEMIVQRKTCVGHGNSLPCVLCRKAIEKVGIKWVAYDGSNWVHSKKTICLPTSIPTNKQQRVLGFRRDNKT